MTVALPFAPQSFVRRLDAARLGGAALVPAHTPLWHATRVLRTTAQSWWDGGVPPSRRRRSQQAVRAVGNMAAHAVAGVGRCLHGGGAGYPAAALQPCC